MPSILNLKFKGNKDFVAFSNLNDTESLTKTWKICTKVASYLEQGSRLENLGWRLWHLQNLMVDTDNDKSKREFKKLSKRMGDKLDKEKGRSIEELETPDFKRNNYTNMIYQRAVEKERNREASQNATPSTINRMQFTFSVDQLTQPNPSVPVKKPDTKPSAEFVKWTNTAPSVRAQRDGEDIVMNDVDIPRESSFSANVPPSLHFPALFGNDFSPSAHLYAPPTLTRSMNYGEGLNPSTNNDQFSISRPTIELPVDDLLFDDDASDDDGSHSLWRNSSARRSRRSSSAYHLPTHSPMLNAESQQKPKGRDDVLSKLIPLYADPWDLDARLAMLSSRPPKSPTSSSSSYGSKQSMRSRASSWSNSTGSHIPGTNRDILEFPFGYPTTPG